MLAELRGVTKRDGPILALDNLTLSLAPGRVTALLGPNGAGKTTTVRLLLGLTRPTSGTVRLFGGDPAIAEARRRTGVMLQASKVPETLRVREHVHLFCSYYPKPMRVDDALPAAGLTSRYPRGPRLWTAPAGRCCPDSSTRTHTPSAARSSARSFLASLPRSTCSRITARPRSGAATSARPAALLVVPTSCRRARWLPHRRATAPSSVSRSLPWNPPLMPPPSWTEAGGIVIRVLIAEDQTMILGALAALLDIETDLEVRRGCAPRTPERLAVRAKRAHPHTTPRALDTRARHPFRFQA